MSASAPFSQEKAAKERARADWLNKKGRLELNKQVQQLVALSPSPAAWGIADAPIDEADEAAVIGRLTRETATLDPNNPALYDLDAALTASCHLVEEVVRNKECCVCLEEPGADLWTINCLQSGGKHKVCRRCVIADMDHVSNTPGAGKVVKVRESFPGPNGSTISVKRKVRCCRCPMCRQPFLSAWSPLLGRAVSCIVERYPLA